MKCRPSELYGITETVQAFCFDRAVVIFGSALRAELEGAKGKTEKSAQASRRRILKKWIPEATTDSTGKRKFRDPASEVTV